MKKFITSLFLFGVLTLQSQAPTQEDKEVIIRMKLSQWNIVLKALRELPYKESEEPIGEIMYQAQQQLNPPPPAKTQPKGDTTNKKP